MPDSCGRSGACNSSYSTIGVSSPSMPPHDTTCWKFSKNAMDDDPPSSPATFRSTNGTTSSAIRLTPTLSSTASSTTPTASISLETAFAEPAKGPPKKIDHPQQAMAQLRSQRGPRPGRHHIGIHGQHHLGMPGRLHRNPHPSTIRCPRRPMGRDGRTCSEDTMGKQENSQIVETAKEARGAELGPTVRNVLV